MKKQVRYEPVPKRTGHGVDGASLCRGRRRRAGRCERGAARPPCRLKLCVCVCVCIMPRKAAVSEPSHAPPWLSPGPAQEIERLLAAQADINATDNAGLVPLHIAAGEGASAAVRGPPSPRHAAAARLLHCCVCLRAPRAALNPAAALQAKCLCENGADVNAQSGFDDSTALHRVVSSVSQRAVCCTSAQHRICALLSPSHAGTYVPLSWTERAPAGRGGAQRLPRGARCCRRRPQRQVASCRDCALRQLRAASDALACPCIPHMADDWRTRF